MTDKANKKYFAFQLLRPIIIPVFKLWYNPKIVGKEWIPDRGAAVVAGNHKHALDPLLVYICTKRTVHTLAKSELFSGLFGWFFKLIGSIPVDLEAKNNPDAFHTALGRLKTGSLINVSPEAERNFTNKTLLPFKYGAVVMTKRAGCQLVPYAITGDYKFRSKSLKITFLEPLDLTNLDIEKSNQLLFNTIKELLLKETSQT